MNPIGIWVLVSVDYFFNSKFVIGERFIDLSVNLHKDPKGRVFQKSERFRNLLFLHEVLFFALPLDRGIFVN